MIDVSQSVEHDHPHSLDFLRRDITNINDFFRKRGVNVFREWHLFQFIVAVGIKKGEEMAELEKLMEELEIGESGGEVEESILKRITIPRHLGNIPM